MARRSGPVTPAEAVAGLTATVQRRWRDWLASPAYPVAPEKPTGDAGGTGDAGSSVDAGDAVSVDLSLHPPTGKAAAADVAGTSAWIRSWQAWSAAHPAADVVWVEKSWTAAGLGRQRVPDRLQVTGVENLVTLTGQSALWRGLTRRFALLVGEDPTVALRAAAAAVMTRWRDLPDEDIVRVHAVVDWFLAHPSSGLTPRAVPVEGVHGKWLERHLTLITRLVAARAARQDRTRQDDADFPGTDADPTDGNSGTVERTGTGTASTPLAFLGLVGREPQIRFRFPAGLPGWSGVPEDVTLTFSGAASLWADGAVPVTGVLVVENLETFLALPSVPGRALLWGSGYAAVRAAQLPWLAGLPVWYWGDLDADGFAILAGVRTHLPQVTSVLMDTGAVRRWRHLATVDEHPDRRNLPCLTTDEGTALDLLASLGNLRIEQERILLADAVEALADTGYYPGRPGHTD